MSDQETREEEMSGFALTVGPPFQRNPSIPSGVIVTSTSPTAAWILEQIRDTHKTCAFVPEVTINDPQAMALSPEDADYPQPPTRRIDALMFDWNQRTAIEIKVTKEDLDREDWRKTRPWERVTHRFIYVTPAGLVDKPPIYGAGLWWVHPDGRTTVKRRATINKYPEPLPQEVVRVLAYRAAGVETIKPQTTESMTDWTKRRMG